MNDTGTNASNCAEAVPPAGLTLGDLIHAYQTDRVSTFHQLRYNSRKNSATVLKRLATMHGATPLADIKRRTLTEWHMDWSAGGKLSMAQDHLAAVSAEAEAAYVKKHSKPMPADSASYVRKRYDLLQQRAKS